MQRLVWVTETIAACFMLLIAALTAGNVLLRNVFSATLPDWYDSARLTLGVASFWGIALATYAGRHICVDLLWEPLGPGNRKRMDLVATAISAIFLACMATMIWIRLLDASGQSGQVTSDLRVPIIWFTVVCAAGATAGAVLSMLRLWNLASAPLSEAVEAATI